MYNIVAVIKQHKNDIMLWFLLVLGCLARCVAIDIVPQGLNVDEASVSYEAFSILNYGMDRNGNTFPVFLEAWGSGQSALYTYIMIPFIKILGLNIFSTRLPMAIIGCISLFVWYKLLYLMKNQKFALIGLAFLAICPWHIMKSRWGLECNLFPDITLYAVFFVVKFLKSKKYRYFYLAFVFLGMTAYTYGTAYFFLPFFVISLLVYLRVKKEISTLNAIAGLAIVGIISLPIIGYVIINTFDLPEIHIGIFTIPKLPVNRFEEQTSLFTTDNFFKNLIQNFWYALQVLLLQEDGLVWNAVPGYGLFYIITLPFVVVGIIFCIKQRNTEKMVMNFWLFAAFLLLFVFHEANINRINILIFPLIYYAIEGMYAFGGINHHYALTLAVLYGVFFVAFEITYFTRDTEEAYVFVDDVKEVIEYVDSVETENVYFEYAFKEPYIYVLYYTQYQTDDFINTMQYFDEENIGRFDNVKGFGKYHFYLPEDFEEENAVYVLSKNGQEENLTKEEWNIVEFEKYIVVEKK